MVEGTHFRKTVEERLGGLLGFERHLDELKFRLGKDPTGVGRQPSPETPRYAVTIDAGTLDWQVLVDFVIKNDEVVELIQVFPKAPNSD